MAEEFFIPCEIQSGKNPFSFPSDTSNKDAGMLSFVTVNVITFVCLQSESMHDIKP